MCEQSAWITRFLLASICVLLLWGNADAQVAHLRTVEEQASGFMVEVTALWPASLSAMLDSLGAAQLTDPVFLALSGQYLSASKTFTLPSLTLPRAQILSSEYDEINLRAANGTDSLIALISQSPLELGRLGMMRKRPAATLEVRLTTYDESRGVLRRYRRLLIRVDYGGAAPSDGLESFAKTAFTSGTNPHLEVTKSVLADGYVFKIPVTTEGIYKIDRATLMSMLEQAGISMSAVNPGQVKLFGNGGEPLPALNSEPRPADLIENPVLVTTSGTSFSELIFFAKGASGWRYNAEAQQWEHYVNPFSKENYYFLKIDTGGEPGKRVESQAFPGYPSARQLRAVTGRYFVEPDEVMWTREGASGHTWVSKQIRSGQRMALFEGVSLPGLTSGTVQYHARVAINSNPVAGVRFESGGSVLAEVTAAPVSTLSETPIANTAETKFSQQISGGPLDLSMSLQNRPNDPQAAIDWIRVLYPKSLRAEDDYLRFSTPAGEAGQFEFVLEGFSQAPLVWDVTEPGNIRQYATRPAGNAHLVQIEVTDGSKPREMVAFIPGVAKVTEGPRRVAQQNLHGIQTYPDFVIVVPDTFRVYADELAEMRRGEGLVVEVVGIDQIFNEFSGGLRDMRAIRDYFKFLYDRGPDDARTLRYALLFGDGHYDFREINQPEYENWIPPYETEETFHPMRSYTSDDYFGLLDDNEGVWAFRFDQAISEERIDIGIGRLPVQSAAEARAVIDKLKHYEDPATYGPWRTRYTFIADDGFNDLAAVNRDSDLHVQNADVVAEELKVTYPNINLQKIYAVSYPREYGTAGWRIPEAERDIKAAINNGTLLVNYSGHGGEDALTQERIFTREHAQLLENFDRLPVFVTATCSFGRWDMDGEQSGAEVLLSNENGGAIALLTTVRTVYTSFDSNTLNVGLNRILNRALFETDENGLPRRLGDAFFETKNEGAGLESNNRKFSLLGDPTMRLGIPAYRAAVKSVNGIDPSGGDAQLKALDRVTVRGEIQHPNGIIDETFEGRVNVTVFDAERTVQLPYNRFMPTPYYTVREDLIWRGDVDVQSGRFEATFVVPKDISYSNQPGRIAIYARADSRQAIGFTDSVLVGGSSANPPQDSQGPKISIFLNDTTFVSGGLTSANPELIVKLEDESGVNTVGAGVGHEMLLILDNDEQNAVNISSFYESEQNSYQRGQVRSPLNQFFSSQSSRQLNPGHHVISVKAWDVLNNSSTATLEFYLTEGEELTLRNVYNYPNPTTGETRFIFEHNQPPGIPARVQVRIYTISGRPVRTIETDEALPGGVLSGSMVQIPWDGRDEDWDPLATGIYLYKLRVEIDGVEGERQVSEMIEKLAIIR